MQVTFSKYFNGLFPYLSDGSKREDFFDAIIGNFICDEVMDSCELLTKASDTKKRYVRAKNPNSISEAHAQFVYQHRDTRKYADWLYAKIEETDTFEKIEEWLEDSSVTSKDVSKDCTELLENIFLDIIGVVSKKTKTDVSLTPRQVDETNSGKVLQPTLQERNYNETFEEVASATLGLSNPEKFKIFRLKLEDYVFEYNTLQQFLTRNLGRYVHSRAKMRKYKISDDLESVGIEAAQIIRENCTGEEVGALLLYSFLEKEMNAPKILSSIELGANRRQCAGIHLITLGESNISHQLVYGASNIQGSLRSAIDDAFANIVKIKASKPSAMELVDSATFNCAFDPATTEYIKQMIVPSKSNKDNATTAFGIFLGYSLKMPDEAYTLSNEDFKNTLVQQLKDDINSQKDYIFSRISSLRLGMHSFYIFVLPFNDADQDQTLILTRLVGGTANGQ